MARKTSRIRRTFTAQFKKDAVALVTGGRSLSEVAHDLGIARSLLQRWKAQLAREPDLPAAFPGRGSTTSSRLRASRPGVIASRASCVGWAMAPILDQALAAEMLAMANAVAESFFHMLKTELVYPAPRSHARGGPPGDLRVHRGLLQSHPSALDEQLPLTR